MGGLLKEFRMIFKQLFQTTGNGSGARPEDVRDVEPTPLPETPAPVVTLHETAAPPPLRILADFKSFDQIYENAGLPKNGSYDILKVAEMTRSPHLATMSIEAKRSSLLMALEAAGVDVEDVLQDAMMRQRALDHYEDTEQKRLHEFEEQKLNENCAIQAELDRATAQFLSRIQVNLDAVEKEQNVFRSWQKRKQQESNRIAEAASFSIPATSGASSMNAVADRIKGRAALSVGD